MTNVNTLYLLNSYCLVTVESADNLKFLQGQVTCDVRETSDTSWRYGALCTNKGRVIGNFLLAEPATNTHQIRIHHSTANAVLETLQKFAPFYKGSVSLNNNYTLLGLSGTNCESIIQSVFAQSAGEQSLYTNDDYILVKLESNRYEVWLRTETAEKYQHKLTQHCETQSENDWDLLNIRAGLAEVREQTIEEWTPHMLNLHRIEAVNFKKGCYTGQEIVARTEYKGIQKQSLFGIKGNGSKPEPNSKIFNGDKKVGEVVAAANSESDSWEALAVINSQAAELELSFENTSISLFSLAYPSDQA